MAVGAYKADGFAELNRWAGDCALRSTQKVSSTVDALAALANRQRSASRTGRVAGDACQRQSICEFAALTLRSALIDFDLQVKLLRTVGVAFGAFGEAGAVAGLAAERALEASAEGCVRVVGVRACPQAAVVQEKVVLRTGQRSAVFSCALASNAGGAAGLAEIGNAGSNEGAVGTGRRADGVIQMLVVGVPCIRPAGKAEVDPNIRTRSASRRALLTSIIKILLPHPKRTIFQTNLLQQIHFKPLHTLPTGQA